MILAPTRRIVVGVAADGRSVIADDVREIASTVPLAGYRVQELWRQGSVPGAVNDEGVVPGDIDIDPPESGAVVRVLTIQPEPEADWVPNPHGDNNRHVLTLVAGMVDLVLEGGVASLAPGDTVVLSGHVHDWRNSYDAPAVLLYTTFPLA